MQYRLPLSSLTRLSIKRRAFLYALSLMVMFGFIGSNLLLGILFGKILALVTHLVARLIS
jgi:hypothetical protein